MTKLSSLLFEIFVNESFEFEAPEISDTILVKFANIKEYKTLPKYLPDTYNSEVDDIFNLSFDTTHNKADTSYSVVMQIFKTIIDIVNEFISDVSPFGITIYGMSELEDNSISFDQAKSEMYLRMINIFIPNGYEAKPVQYLSIDGYLIFKK